jgi:hypothetical protein
MFRNVWNITKCFKIFQKIDQPWRRCSNNAWMKVSFSVFNGALAIFVAKYSAVVASKVQLRASGPQLILVKFSRAVRVDGLAGASVFSFQTWSFKPVQNCNSAKTWGLHNDHF